MEVCLDAGATLSECVVRCRLPIFLVSAAVVVEAGWGELRAAGGMGEVAGRSRGRVGRVPEEQPAAAWPSWAAPEYSSDGRLVGLSVGGVRKSSFRLAGFDWLPWGRSFSPRMLGVLCRRREMTLSFPAKDSPSTGWPSVRGGQAS